MFEASRSRGFPVLGLVVAGMLAAGGWLAYRGVSPAPAVAPVALAAVAPPAPVAAPSDVVEATPQEVRAALQAVLEDQPGGRLFHLDCTPPGCLATVRIPSPRGPDAGWRNQVEVRLKKDGWNLRPAGRVERFEARHQDDMFIPERVLWTFGMRRRPDALTPEEKAALADRVDSQMRDSVLRLDPW